MRIPPTSRGRLIATLLVVLWVAQPLLAIAHAREHVHRYCPTHRAFEEASTDGARRAPRRCRDARAIETLPPALLGSLKSRGVHLHHRQRPGAAGGPPGQSVVQDCLEVSRPATAPPRPLHPSCPSSIPPPRPRLQRASSAVEAKSWVDVRPRGTSTSGSRSPTCVIPHRAGSPASSVCLSLCLLPVRVGPDARPTRARPPRQRPLRGSPARGAVRRGAEGVGGSARPDAAAAASAQGGTTSVTLPGPRARPLQRTDDQPGRTSTSRAEHLLHPGRGGRRLHRGGAAADGRA